MDLDARVAALETDRVEQRAVLAAVERAECQSAGDGTDAADHSQRLDRLESKVDRLDVKTDDTNARVRSLEEGVAEIKDLLVQALGK